MSNAAYLNDKTCYAIVLNYRIFVFNRFFHLHGEGAGLRGFGGGGLVGLAGQEVLEPPGDWEGEADTLTVSPLGTMTHSSESLEGDVSLLDLEIRLGIRSNLALDKATLHQRQCKRTNI